MPNAYEIECLKHELNNEDIPDIGDPTGLRGSTTPGNLWLSLHTADPGETGSAQTTNECTYPGYVRMPATRDGSFWNIPGNAINLIEVVWPEHSGGSPASQTVNYVCVGKKQIGAGAIMRRGAVSEAQVITVGIAPRLKVGTIVLTQD
jgi:hypothetical protein